MKSKINPIIVLAIALLPSMAFAIDFKGFVRNSVGQIALIPQTIFILTFTFFIWNIFQYIKANDPKQVKESREMITYSIIGLFIMVSVWGLINLLVNTFVLDNSVIPTPSLDRGNTTGGTINSGSAAGSAAGGVTNSGGSAADRASDWTTNNQQRVFQDVRP